jgi:hypothetical protein
MVMAGPLGGVVFSLLCWMVLKIAAGEITGWVFVVLYTCLRFGLMANALNLMPWRRGALRLDGRVLWDAWFDRRTTENMVATFACSSSLRGTLDPREWRPEWVAGLRKQATNSLAVALLGCSAEARLLLDAEDREARADLQRVCERSAQLKQKLKLKGAQLAAFDLQQAWLRGRYRGELLELNAEDLAKAPGIETYELLRYRALRAVQAGDREGAAALLREAAESVGGSPTGVHRLQRDVLDRYRVELLQPETAFSL